MASNDIYINYLLDRSGSMSSIWEATVEGFNGYKSEQAKEEGTAWITLTAFDMNGSLVPSYTTNWRPAVKAYKQKSIDIEVVFDSVKAEECPDLTDQIRPRGGTPLLDAIGIAIENTEDWVASHKDFDGKVLVVINTDGYENASQEFDLAGIKASIERKEKDGWEFAFMGAGIDAFGEANKLGIASSRTLSYDATPDAAMASSMRLNSATTQTRSGKDFSWDSKDSD